MSYYRFSLLVLLLALPGRSAVVARENLTGLVERSELIVQARCLRSWAAWDAETNIIWTHTELAVVDRLKGVPGARIVVSEPGGIVDGVGMAVEGAPRYAPGEEVVVFLYHTPQGLVRTRGLGQGKFTIRADPDGRQRRVKTNLGGLTLVAPPGGTSPSAFEQDKLDGMNLNQFLGLLRDLAGRQR